MASVRLAFIYVSLALLSGCAGIGARTRDGAGRPFAGVREDWHYLAHPSEADVPALQPLNILDMPLSLVVDLVCLPHDLSVSNGASFRPPPGDLCRLALKPAFQGDDEQVWQLTIETREPVPYRIVSAFTGGWGSLSGATSPSERGRARCHDEVWIVFTRVTPPGDGPAQLTTLVQGAGGRLTQTREVARGTGLGALMAPDLTLDRQDRPQNTAVVLADLDGQRVRLMVGAGSDELETDPGGFPISTASRR